MGRRGLSLLADQTAAKRCGLRGGVSHREGSMQGVSQGGGRVLERGSCGVVGEEDGLGSTSRRSSSPHQGQRVMSIPTKARIQSATEWGCSLAVAGGRAPSK